MSMRNAGGIDDWGPDTSGSASSLPTDATMAQRRERVRAAKCETPIGSYAADILALIEHGEQMGREDSLKAWHIGAEKQNMLDALAAYEAQVQGLETKLADANRQLEELAEVKDAVVRERDEALREQVETFASYAKSQRGLENANQELAAAEELRSQLQSALSAMSTMRDEARQQLAEVIKDFRCLCADGDKAHQEISNLIQQLADLKDKYEPR